MNEFERDNIRRSVKAEIMLKDAGYEGIISDAICDLHHLADSLGQDWPQILEDADFHYDAEVAKAITGRPSSPEAASG